MAVATMPLRQTIEREGYAVVPGVVPKEHLRAVVEDIWQHTGAWPDDRESWYRETVRRNGMVEMYHYQSMWNARQHPHLYEVFCDVYESKKLWVSIDRTNLKPPADAAHPEHNSVGFIHWDTDTARYPDVPYRVQAVLALEDTEAAMGGFQCVPELYRDLADWLARQPKERNPRQPDLAGYDITKVALHAGDLVVWHVLMPHGNGHNTSDRPRLAQYISMAPANEDNAEARQARIACWQQRKPMAGTAFPGDPRGTEQHFPAPELTPLGRKLLGVDRWE